MPFMALQATHIRFALAIKPHFEIDDISAYCSGAAYPDTRYVTGIARELTHGPGSPQDPFADDLTDFERGWASHLLYDRLEGAEMRTLIPPHLGVVEQQVAAWIEMTAMKVVEDMTSVRLLGKNISHLFELVVDVAPRGEDTDRIQKYFSFAAELYGTQCTLEDYMVWARNFGASDAIISALQNRTAQILADSESLRKIIGIFDAAVQKTHERGL